MQRICYVLTHVLTHSVLTIIGANPVMHTLLPRTALWSLLLFSTSIVAADIATITLDNGAKIRLKDDFTWEYIITENDNRNLPVTPPALGSTTAVNTTVNPPILNANALARPELLGSTAKDGIKVSLAESQWKDDKLGLIFDLASSSSKHVTLVEVEVSFFADNGTLLKNDTLEVWKAIFRLPETYLRKGEQRKSPVVWIKGIEKAQWQKQLIHLKITEINSR